MPPTKKERFRINRSDTATWTFQGSSSTENGKAWQHVGGTQYTESEGHLWPSEKRSGDDVGGDFYTVKRSFNDNRGDELNPSPRVTSTISRTSAFEGQTYFGPVFPHSMNPADVKNRFPNPNLATSRGELEELGTTAVALCKPTNSIANLSTTLGELMTGGLPSLVGSSMWRERASVARGAAGEHLNLQFGLLPLISDLKDVVTALKKSDAVLKQYRRDAGRNVRRRYEFPVERSTTVISTTSGANPYPVYTGSSKHSGSTGRTRPSFSARHFAADATSQGTLVRTRETVTKRWFSGAFTYAVPDDPRIAGMDRSMQELDKLYGIGIDAETLWNLAPWSWAVDWFSNAGDVFSTYSDYQTHGLLLRYGYMMEHFTCTDTYTLTNHGLRAYPGPISASYKTEVKQRVRATPFGFGVSWNGLDQFQLSILAALGISRRGR